MDYLARAQKVIATEVAEIQRLSARLGSEFSRAVELIRTRVEQRGKIIVMGVGKSGHIGEKIAATLTSTGSPAIVLNSLNAIHGDLGIVSDGDVLLAFSFSGETEEMLNILPALKRFDLPIIAITGNPLSTLALNAELVLDVNVEQEACPLNLAPTSSTTVMLVLGDALAMVLLEARGFKKEDFAKFHPGGTLGRALLMKVSDVMRPREQIAVVTEQTPIRDVLRAMTRCRSGAAVILSHPQEQVIGVFTHGDFVRNYQQDPAVGDRPVGPFMTRNPVTIRGDRLAAEVLRVLETVRVDELVVVDPDNHPIGIVDTADLTRLKLL